MLPLIFPPYFVSKVAVFGPHNCPFLPPVVADPSFSAMKSAIRLLGQFYGQNGPRATMTANPPCQLVYLY